jgi:hypothetical protein
MPPFLVFLTLHWIYENNFVWVKHGDREHWFSILSVYVGV